MSFVLFKSNIDNICEIITVYEKLNLENFILLCKSIQTDLENENSTKFKNEHDQSFNFKIFKTIQLKIIKMGYNFHKFK